MTDTAAIREALAKARGRHSADCIAHSVGPCSCGVWDAQDRAEELIRNNIDALLAENDRLRAVAEAARAADRAFQDGDQPRLAACLYSQQDALAALDAAKGGEGT